MLSFYGKYSRNYTYSQNGEEGLIEECLRRMGIETGKCFEAGGHNGRYLSNTALLLDKGWSGKFVEADFDLWNQCCNNWKHAKDRVRSLCSEIGPDNADAFIESDVVVCSIDVDGNDLAIFKAMTARAAIVIVEINSGFPPDVEHDSFEQGSSYLTMAKAAIDKGYFVLCHTGNMVLVEETYRELFPEVEGDGISNHELYFRRDWLKKTA
jgi:hypothetical protein